MTPQDQLEKIRACWLGKCLAGAIGAPWEGVPFPLHVGEEDIALSDVPNDDLELQLVWLDAVRRHGVSLTARDLGETWLARIPHGCDEYSIALRNLAHGVAAPASGWRDNFFHDGMGAAIRSEIWALLFAGRPDAAAHFAQQDAEVDHWGDGVRGEIYMATAEAHALAHSDIPAALRFAFDALPPDCRLQRELSRVFVDYDAGVPDTAARDALLLGVQRSSNFTDCVMNLCFITHALLRGDGDFLKTVFAAVSFGRDTDCTAASCGAFLGAALGMGVFPERWRNAMGERLVLSDFVRAIPGVPLTLTELVGQTAELREALAQQLPAEPYPPYLPYAPTGGEPVLDPSSWLVLREGEPEASDLAALEVELRGTGRLPPWLRGRVASFDTLFPDISRFAKGAKTLHLFSFLQVPRDTIDPDSVTLSATADVGIRVWMDGRKLLDQHSRQRMLPSFHRPEGGAAFSLPLAPGSRHLFHVALPWAMAPLRFCLMFGNARFDHLDGYRFSI